MPFAQFYGGSYTILARGVDHGDRRDQAAALTYVAGVAVLQIPWVPHLLEQSAPAGSAR
jgi:hypothetical protein